MTGGPGARRGRRLPPVLLITIGAAACGGDDPGPPAYDAAVPAPEIERIDPAALEHARDDSAWRTHAENDRRLRPRPRPSVLRVQVLLDRARFSPGVIDGQWGQNTEKAVFWFQHEQGLGPTGLVDDDTHRRLRERAGDAAPLARYRVRAEDLEGPFAPVPAHIYDKARRSCLCYTSPLELLSERFHTTPALLRRLNPEVDFERLAAGTALRVPNVRRDPEDRRIERIVISRGGSYTHALDEKGDVVYHFPSTLGSRYSPSPTGEYRVRVVVPWPRFHYTPDLFHDVPDDRPEAVLPPGPNSPIGVVWIELSRPHYGIHGTAAPETIGYVTSHGCVRLTNWDARTLARGTRPGTPVEFR